MHQFLVDLYDHMVSDSGPQEGGEVGMGLECDVDGDVTADGWSCSDHHCQRIQATCSQ